MNQLTEKKYWIEVEKPGDWAWLPTLEKKTLVLSCPICGYNSAIPFSMIEKEKPLTIRGPVWCPNCRDYFNILEGVVSQT